MTLSQECGGSSARRSHYAYAEAFSMRVGWDTVVSYIDLWGLGGSSQSENLAKFSHPPEPTACATAVQPRSESIAWRILA